MGVGRRGAEVEGVQLLPRVAVRHGPCVDPGTSWVLLDSGHSPLPLDSCRSRTAGRFCVLCCVTCMWPCGDGGDRTIFCPPPSLSTCIIFLSYNSHTKHSHPFKVYNSEGVSRCNELWSCPQYPVPAYCPQATCTPSQSLPTPPPAPGSHRSASVSTGLPLLDVSYTWMNTHTTWPFVWLL